MRERILSALSALDTVPGLVHATFSVGGGQIFSPSYSRGPVLDFVPLLSPVSRDRDERGFARGVGHKVMGAQRPPESYLQAEDPKILGDWLSPGVKSSESRTLMV